jgi:hypothetical protein
MGGKPNSPAGKNPNEPDVRGRPHEVQGSEADIGDDEKAEVDEKSTHRWIRTRHRKSPFLVCVWTKSARL